jgi:hypothetical protein
MWKRGTAGLLVLSDASAGKRGPVRAEGQRRSGKPPPFFFQPAPGRKPCWFTQGKKLPPSIALSFVCWARFEFIVQILPYCGENCKM